MMKVTHWILGATVAMAATSACYVSSTGSSSQGSSSGCGTVPASCPSTNPSYASDVAPILFQYCVSCHGPGGSLAGKPLDSYAAVKKLSGNVEKLTANCSMPPASAAAQPSSAERDTVLAWVVCGAQDN